MEEEVPSFPFLQFGWGEKFEVTGQIAPLQLTKKKMELQAPAKERGDERAQNYFDPSSAQQIDPRHCRMAGVSTEDELELTILNADENRLYQRMAALLDENDTLIDIPGTLQASRDEEVLEVKTGDPVLQRRLLLHGGGHASGSRPSQAHTIAKTQDEASTGLGGEAGLKAGRMVMGRESTVKMRIAEEVIPHYAQQLRERVQPDMITLGSLSLQQQVAQKEPLKGREWANRKKRLMAVLTGNVKELHSQRDSDEAGGEAPPPRLNTLLQCSGTIESPSLRALGEGQEEAVAKFDQMIELPESSSSASQPMWQVNQRTTQQPVEVCVCCLRATRDKLPRGLYIVRVALNSRLGGPALPWRSKKEQQQWNVSTEPIEHQGRFYDTDLHINQNLFMILPAACEIVPSMVLIFQLIALRGDGSHISSVLAWGAFPVCGPSLSLIQGRGSHLEHLGGLSVASLYRYPLLTRLSCPNLRSIMTNPRANCHSIPSSHHSHSSVLSPFIPNPSYTPNSSHTRAPAAEQESPLWYILTGGLLSTCQLILLALPHLCQKKLIKKAPSMSSSSAPPRQQADKQKMQLFTENLSTEEMEEYTFLA
ncbi:uncharacterized protein AKAME5_002114100 [Lates japonicus]|uniref:Uncharacterized protein n=1 Tax=Lates japonicus TaxID=270547 RepID=A0AAD3RGN7_LATJO|nr:uncharacterized protein AKAME5_002114100 [Lates japonicus]